MNRATNLLIFFMLIAPCAAAQATANNKDREAIKSIALKWQDAWNRHDLKALAALAAEDVDLVTVSGTRLRSRKEFLEDHTRSHETVLRESVLTTDSVEVKFVRPDVAVAHFEWSITGVKAPDGTSLPPQRGIFIWVLTKRKEAWVIIAAQNTIIREQVPSR